MMFGMVVAIALTLQADAYEEGNRLFRAGDIKVSREKHVSFFLSGGADHETEAVAAKQGGIREP